MKPIVTIPNPCDQNWDAMTPSSQGRHCAACDKVVMDLSGLDNTQLLQLIANSRQQICGRVRKDVLDAPSGKAGLSVFRKVFLSITGTLSLWLLHGTVNTQISEQDTEPTAVFKRTLNKKGILSLHITDEQGKPVRFAEVATQGRPGQKFMTDESGNCRLEITPEDYENDQLIIHIQCLGFAPGKIENPELSKDHTFISLKLKKEEVPVQTLNLISTDKFFEDKPEIYALGAFVRIERVCNPEPFVEVNSGTGEEPDNPEEVSEELPEAELFRVYPVPTQRWVNVECPGETKYEANLINNQGHLIRQFGQGSGRRELDLGGLPPGIYYLQIRQENRISQTIKVVLAI